MKKTININLGGQPFIIDEPAFDILHHYFEALKLKFNNESEQKEILADIEGRIAELFTQRLGKVRSVVSEEDVTYVISLMGKPEDIAGESDSASAPQDNKAASSATYTGPVEKKFFRDPDNKKVGGVISGLCHYFGWGDPTWIRLVVLALVILSFFTPVSFGIPIAVIYLILLIVVPEATTSAEKLQMQGKPVTLQNIEKEVRDAMTTAGNSVNTMLKDNGIRGNIGSVLIMIGSIIRKIILGFVMFICIVLMLALVASFFGLSILSSASLTDFTHLFVSSRYTIMIFDIGLLLAVGIPLVAVLYDVIRFLTGSQVTSPVLKRVLWGAWFIGIVLLGISLWTVLRQLAASDTINEKVQLVTPARGTLHIQVADSLGHMLEPVTGDDIEISSFVHIDKLSKTLTGFAFGDVKLEIAVSPDSNFYMEKVAFSKGANFADAGKNIEMISYKFSQNDSVLNLDNKFEIPKDGQWRAQHIKIRVLVPEGKRVIFAQNVDHIEAWVKGNDYFDDGAVSNKTLQVIDGKIKCINCKEKMITQDDDSDEGPGAPEPPSPPGTHFSIQDGKDSDDLKDLNINISEKGMEVKGKNNKSEHVKVQVNENGVSITKTDSMGHKKKFN